jgi:hypothetical protein
MGNILRLREQCVMISSSDDNCLEVDSLIFSNNFAFTDTTKQYMYNVGFYNDCRRVIISNNQIIDGFWYFIQRNRHSTAR